MGNNQGNQKGTAQDQRERANQVQKGDSKDSKDTRRGQQVPREKGDADPGEHSGGALQPGTPSKKRS